MSELGEVRASLARAQRELDAVHERLDALQSLESAESEGTKTALVPRVVERQRRQLILVGALSSAATAILLGLGSLFVPPTPAAPPVIAASPPPPPPIAPEIPPPPPPVTVAVPEPPPPPVVAEPPRPPVRVARVSPPKEEAPKRARPDDVEMGSLTIICLPVKCDSIVDNGAALGPGHIFNHPVAVGRHQLVLRANDVTKNIRVDVHADQLREVRVMMQDASGIF